MIRLTRLQGTPLYLNEDLIETVEPTHDIVVNLTNGHSYVVSESADEVLSRILEAKADVLVAAVRRAGVRINITHDSPELMSVNETAKAGER